MEKLLMNFRHVAWVAVVASFISALTMLTVGVVKVGKIVWLYAQGKSNMVFVGSSLQAVPGLSQEDGVTARAIESLDAFLIAAVLIYFGYGMYTLFCARKDDPVIAALPSAIVPASLGELKQTLGQIILVVLMILFARQVWLELYSLRWEHLIIPVGVLLLAGGLRLSGVGKTCQK